MESVLLCRIPFFPSHGHLAKRALWASHMLMRLVVECRLFSDSYVFKDFCSFIDLSQKEL